MYKVRRLSSAAMLLHHPEATDCGEINVFSQLKKDTFTRVMVSLWAKIEEGIWTELQYLDRATIPLYICISI